MSRPAPGTKIHLDTDLGGDIDDLCALAMLLRWPGVELVGVTTTGEDRGRRAGYVRYVLSLEGIGGIPVAAGADVSGGYYRWKMEYPPEDRYWPEPVAPSPNPIDEALDLIKSNIESGATVIAIGPYTNLALLEARHPGILKRTKIFLMGGSIQSPRSGYPDWGHEMDYNIQVDVKSARHVLENANPTLVPLSATVETFLRSAHLYALRRAGALGKFIARQAEAFAADEPELSGYGARYAGLPRDFINFLHDPLACAIALDWDEGVDLEKAPLLLEEQEGWLRERIDPAGRLTRVVTRIDGACFSQFWLERLTRS